MRMLTRFGLGLAGRCWWRLRWSRRIPRCPAMALPSEAQVTGHHHKGVFGWRHCVTCQRAWAKHATEWTFRRPPPVSPPESFLARQSTNTPMLRDVRPRGSAVVTGPVTITDSYPPDTLRLAGRPSSRVLRGYAVVGGGPEMVGADPSPVGVARAWASPGKQPPVGRRPQTRRGSYDASVMPSSMIPAPTGLTNPSGGRPHVISHLLGVGTMSREYRQNRDSKSRERHAAIS